MTRLIARSLVLVGAVAAGCTPLGNTTRPIDETGAAGSGQVTITTHGEQCSSTTAGGMGSGVATGTGEAIPIGVPPPGSSSFPPQVGDTHTAAEAPPAISGGTLLVLADGNTAVAADPDRDQVYIVELAQHKVSSTIALNHGDEPGRVVADSAGRVHVALRHGGALVTISPTTGTLVDRRAVCAAPRGVAYEAATDLLHVACADGQLVSLPAAGGAAVRTLQLDGDLRDVVVDGSNLRVSRFRSAELLTVGADGTMSERLTPPGFRSLDTRNGQTYTASTAWRAMSMPTGGVVMLHQRGLMDEVQPTAGGYGGFSPCDAIVQTAITTVTTVAPGQETTQTGPAMAGMVLPVDMALSSDGTKVAIIAAGNSTNSEVEGGPARLPRLFVTDMSSASDPSVGCMSDGQHGPCLPINVGGGAFEMGVTGAAGVSGFSPDGGVATAGSDPTAVDGGTSGTPPVPVPSPPLPDSCGGATPSTAAASTSVPDITGTPIAVAFAFAGDSVDYRANA